MTAKNQHPKKDKPEVPTEAGVTDAAPAEVQAAPVAEASPAPAAKTPPPAPADHAKTINVHHLTRVEGHGTINVEIDSAGTVKSCRWEVVEAPRFFEAMLLGRPYQDIHHITSRICGICSIGHQLTSLQATEAAFGIRVSDQTIALRKLLLHSENLQSHLLHIGYLVLPDLAGVGSVIPLAKTHREDVLNLVAARRLSNEMGFLIGGRSMHPQRLVPGGWTRLPTGEQLTGLRQELVDCLPRLERIADLVLALAPAIPDFERPTEYIGLVSPSEYALYWGEIGTTKGQRHPAELYRDITREYCVRQSSAKWTRNVTDSFMVGALSRFNLNYDLLTPRAKAVSAKLGLSAPCHNPFMITVAQLVECVHSVEDSIRLIDGLLDKGLKDEPAPNFKVRAGSGVGAVEVPRGILYHAYEYDDLGRIVKADCVIPTNQNHANIQKDMDAMTPLIARESREAVELKLSMLVRAYDPCISCSTHLIDQTGAEGPIRVRFIQK